MSTIAAYVSRTKEISNKVVISQGLRFTNVDLESKFNDQEAFQYLNGTYEQNSSALTWRTGLMYMPGHDWRFSLLGSKQGSLGFLKDLHLENRVRRIPQDSDTLQARDCLL